MWRTRERLQIDRPCDSIHAWVPSDRGESLCPVAKKPISENGESDQALASIASENFGLDRIPSKPNLGVHGAGRTAPARSSRNRRRTHGAFRASHQILVSRLSGRRKRATCLKPSERAASST